MEKIYDKVFEATLVVRPKSAKILKDDEALIKHIKKGALAGGMTLKSLMVDYLHADYKGKKIPSYSIILIVQESHIAIYTYPERNSAHINISTCSSQESLKAIIDYFKSVFEVKSEKDIQMIDIID